MSISEIFKFEEVRQHDFFGKAEFMCYLEDETLFFRSFEERQTEECIEGYKRVASRRQETDFIDYQKNAFSLLVKELEKDRNSICRITSFDKEPFYQYHLFQNGETGNPFGCIRGLDIKKTPKDIWHKIFFPDHIMDILNSTVDAHAARGSAVIKEKISLENAAGFKTNQDDVFGRIASKYDLLCDFFSLGLHRVWKSRVASIISNEKWITFLDTASGTGDIALRVLRKRTINSDQRIVISDISEKMLEIAKKRIPKNLSNIDVRLLDACSMPEIESESIDLFSMSLGLKICDRTSALKEAFRVLKPAGKLVVLEASNIPVKAIHKLYLRYMAIVMPLIGWLATGGDRSAYKYLLQGVEWFPTAEELAVELSQIGFEKVAFERLTFGIVAIHVAVKPAENT